MTYKIIVPKEVAPTGIGIVQSDYGFYPSCPRTGCEGVLIYQNFDTCAMTCTDHWGNVSSCGTKYPSGASSALPLDDMRHGDLKSSQIWRKGKVHEAGFAGWILLWTGLNPSDTSIRIEGS